MKCWNFVKNYEITKVISEIMHYITSNCKALNRIEENIINQSCWMVCDSCWLQYIGLEKVRAQSIKETISCWMWF